MSRSEGERDPMIDALHAMGHLVREVTPPMTPLQRMNGLQAVMRRREATDLRKRRGLVFASALSALGLVAVVSVGLHTRRDAHTSPEIADRGNPIAYRVEHGEIGTGGYLRANAGNAGDGVSLRFAEGTELRLAAGARGRLTSVDGHGARFAIEQGEAQVSVTPRTGARWLIDAGPFLITVHGTVFTAAWDGVTERLDIDMKNGLVSVTGPVADGAIAVRAGQRLTINVQNREVLLQPNADAEAVPAAGGVDRDSDGAGEATTHEAPPAVDAPSTTGVTKTMRPRSAAATGDAARARASTPARSWAAALAAGDLQGILREAQHRGLRRSLSEARSEDLAALADAARYLRHDDIARQALLAQRERFPRSDRARQAAFLLGRLSETGTDGDVRALSWYDRYLSEAPAGSYASEALGRKMTATEKLNGLPAARDLARQYLRRFPGGTYAGAARAMSDAP